MEKKRESVNAKKRPRLCLIPSLIAFRQKQKGYSQRRFRVISTNKRNHLHLHVRRRALPIHPTFDSCEAERDGQKVRLEVRIREQAPYELQQASKVHIEVG